MAERGRRKRPRAEPEVPSKVSEDKATDDDHERMLATMLARIVPALGLLGALVAGKLEGLPSAVLVLAGTALIGTIGFLWASLRTLSGDAPLPEGALDHAPLERVLAPERKRETLRALKDLEFEHTLGKIDDADYRELEARYREKAKALMREMDEGLAPRRQKAEALVAAHLAKKKLDRGRNQDEEEGDDVRAEKSDGAGGKTAPLVAIVRVECDTCHVSNEPDAAFCKKCGQPLGKTAPEADEARDVPA